MSHSSERRLSTGGKPPVRIRQRYMVERVPSHDSTPCFTAWPCNEILQIPQGWSASDFTTDNERPQRSIQIYDTTPGADNLDHLKHLVETLHSETDEERQVQDRGRPNRLDLWGMPLPSDTNTQTRIEKCIAHMSAEIAWRNTVENFEFEISPICSRDKWGRALLIIDRPEERWSQDDGGFVAVFWDANETWSETHAIRADTGNEELEVNRYSRNELDGVLLNFWLGIS
ncbi:hypothetical protein DM02DRAFT_61357 [Periconia macrospinosa]|uniref:Uncharacterized protein n=1 Tax=Periconia macrospinosa TaxID=97972 RepID=A0A2V1DIW2_9PLEO|nr:hypothetical protein DM02DRAFT_61357 [Periconia macrospinosa]